MIGDVMSNFDHVTEEDIANKLKETKSYDDYPDSNNI